MQARGIIYFELVLIGSVITNEYDQQVWNGFSTTLTSRGLFTTAIHQLTHKFCIKIQRPTVHQIRPQGFYLSETFL